MNNKEFSEKIKNNLTIEQINDLLASLGGDPILKGNIIISRTICHNGDSHKLYYYDNTKLFRCYTECSDTFDIFDLIIKNKKAKGLEYSLPQAITFIIKYYNLQIQNDDFQISEVDTEDWKILKKYERNNIGEKEEKVINLKFYDDKILKYLPKPRILPWESEGITKEVMDFCHICYDPIYQGIVIPHYNIDGKLIGIRERTLIKENEINGKYKPAILNNEMYNHPLGFNLYNLNNSKNNIKKIKKVIIFEGEKSCLLYQSFFFMILKTLSMINRRSPFVSPNIKQHIPTESTHVNPTKINLNHPSSNCILTNVGGIIEMITTVITGIYIFLMYSRMESLI